MELHNLRPAKGAVKSRKRIARGQGSGHGGTSTRGHKGDKARAGHKDKRHFEGGQTPLQRRLPKRGFNNINRIEFAPVNLNRLQELAEKYQLDTIDIETLVAKGIVKKTDRVKVLGRGELKTALSISVHAVSASAQQTIEERGGKINLVKFS